jgi:hypothetical protein
MRFLNLLASQASCSTSPTVAFKKFVKWLRVLRRAPPKPRRQRSQAVLRKLCSTFYISAAHKEANILRTQMHSCNAASAFEMLGHRSHFICNAGPNLLPWINVTRQQWSIFSSLGSVEFRRRTTSLVRRRAGLLISVG